MKAGDIWNWAFATMAIMMLFLVANALMLNAVDADKYRGAFVMIIFSVYAGAINVVILGLASVFKKSSEPIIGALLGMALFGGLLFATMAVFVAVVLSIGVIAHEYRAGPCFRVFAGLLFIGVPVLSLAYSIGRRPRKKPFQQSPPPYGSPAAGSPSGEA